MSQEDAQDQGNPGPQPSQAAGGGNGNLDPAVQKLLDECDFIIDDFRAGKINKAKALADVWTKLSDLDANSTVDKDGSFSSFLKILDNHEKNQEAAEQRGRDRAVSPIRRDHRSRSRSRSRGSPYRGQAGDDDEDGYNNTFPLQPSKPTVPRKVFPWEVDDTITSVSAHPLVLKTIELLTMYGADPKAALRSLRLSLNCPEFPLSEWKKILEGSWVNLDMVISGLFATTNNDERSEVVGDLEIKYSTVNPTKKVSDSGQWSTAFNRLVDATKFAFPHREQELRKYGEYINACFSAAHKSFHYRIINYDIAVRQFVGGRRNLQLTDFHEFSPIKMAHLDTIGIAVAEPAQRAPSSGAIRTHTKIQEPCLRWNDGLCQQRNGRCRRMHQCEFCGDAGHKGPDCTKKQ